MKPFNLEAALAGEPVLLRNDRKAILYYCVPDKFKIDVEGTLDSFPVKGMIFDKNGCLLKSTVSWRKNGKFRSSEAGEDIIGMWEEPELTQEELFEKAYKEDLRVIFPKALMTNGYEVIAKTKHGSYIIRNGSYMVDSAVINEPFSLVSNQEPTIDLEDLPKSFTPEETQHYFYINGGFVECKDEYASRNTFDKEASKNGNCFRTREDAEKWLDFMSRFKE